MGSSPNKDRELTQNGRRYMWLTNIPVERYRHDLYQRLAEWGIPIIFHEDAYDAQGRLVSNFVAVFVPEDAREDVEQVLEAAKNGKLEQARRLVVDWIPYWRANWDIVFGLLVESETDEATKREVLATAYDKQAAWLNWWGKRNKLRDVSVPKAKHLWRFAAKLRKGKVAFRQFSSED